MHDTNLPTQSPSTALSRRPQLPTSPKGTVKPAKVHKRSLRGLFLTREEMAAIAAAATSERDRLMIRCLAETGARISELLTLSPSRIHRGFLVLPIEKRRELVEKSVYLAPGSHLLVDLLTYANEHCMRPEAPFFPMTRRRAHQVVTAAAEAAGVYREKKLWRQGVEISERVPAWPHLFRHGAATAMLEDSDDDAVFVQHQLGHKNIQETMGYAQLSEAKRREKAAKLRIAPETWR